MSKTITDQMLHDELIRSFTDIDLFSKRVMKRPLRGYQSAISRAILESVLRNKGNMLAVMLPRQSGKNEISAEAESFLLNLHRFRGGQIVKASPTFSPQSLISIDRLYKMLQCLPGARAHKWGHIIEVGLARCLFYSANEDANVVGATASLLLECDEAQDVNITKWQKDFRPMASSTNATTVLYGTPWTTTTLLAQTIDSLSKLQRRDLVQRVFTVAWEEVAHEVPAYGVFVQSEIDRLGIDHPLIRTQFLLKPILGDGGMFSPAVQSLMRGVHHRVTLPTQMGEYIFCIDVAGTSEDSGQVLNFNPRQDSTVLTIIQVTRRQDTLHLPTYKVMNRYAWIGVEHPTIYSVILSLNEKWMPTQVIIDATGCGIGLASFLNAQLGTRLVQFIFTEKSKSDLGWNFLGICNSGRFQDHLNDSSPEYNHFWLEVAAARHTVTPNANRLMSWGVDDPMVHDDYLMSAALCATLEKAFVPSNLDPTEFIEAPDPITRNNHAK